MPIYAYKCSSCGHSKDALQRISDDPLTLCPACGKDTFSKQVTAAGFQLKGSGWYVTDFRDGANKSAGAPAAATTVADAAGGSASPSAVDATTPAAASGTSTAPAPAPSAASTASAPGSTA